MNPPIDRRRYLELCALAGAVTAGAPLAGCAAPSGADEGTPTPTPTEAPATEPAGGDGEWVETDTVDMTDELTFEPDHVQVAAGTAVTWLNVGNIGHTVTAYEDRIPEGAAYFASGGFDSEDAARDGYPEEGNLLQGESYEHTFETPGEYGYFCVPHELNGMIGYVRVI